MSIEITIHHGKQGHTVYQFGTPSFSQKIQKIKKLNKSESYKLQEYQMLCCTT